MEGLVKSFKSGEFGLQNSNVAGYRFGIFAGLSGSLSGLWNSSGACCILYQRVRHCRNKGLENVIYRSRIEAEIAELRALSDNSKQSRAPVTLDQQSVGRLSRMDAMQQQSMDLAKEERRAQRLAILAAALKRMDEDEFGYCLRCGEEIPPARLDVDPAVTLCVDCVG